MKLEVHEHEGQAECVYCLDVLDGELRACGACRVRVHAACAEELSRCPTLGCVGAWGDVLTGAAAPPRQGTAKGGDDPPPAQVARPRSRWRWPRRAAALALLALAGGWLSTLPRAPGQVAELGGWFHGHGRTRAAIAGTFGAGYRRAFGSASVKALAFSPDGTRLASLDRDRELIEWDWASGRVLREQTLPFAPVFGYVHAAAYAPDRPALVIAVATYVYVVHTETGALEQIPLGRQARISLADPLVEALWVGPEGRVRVAYTSDAPDAVVAEVDLDEPEGGRRLQRRQLDARYTFAAFDPTGEVLVFGNEARVDVWRPGRDEAARLGVPAGFYDAAFAPDGALALLKGPSFLLWDLAGGKALGQHTLGADDWGYELGFSPDGRRLALWAGPTVIYDLARREVVQRLPTHHRLTLAAAWTPDGQHLATGGKDQLARVWEVPERD